MKNQIGDLTVSLTLETAAFEKGADYAQKQAASLGKRMQAMGDKVTGIGAKLSLGITAPFAALVSQAIPAAIESREALGQVTAALSSMGPVAGKTSEQLQAAAKQLETLSTFDDDDILRKVTANLLTFGNVSGEVFDRAQLAIVNLSARLGQDLQQSAIQVGKALNDPVKGMAALARVGVQFSDSQKEAIKRLVETGQVAAAQGIILGELERQFGGAAKAARDASPTAAMQQQWRAFQETIGELALRVLPPLTNFLTKLLTLFNQLDPSTQTWVIGIIALSAALGPVLIAVGSLITLGGTLLPLVLKIGPAFAALNVALTAARISAIALLPALTPFLVPLAALAAAVGAVYLAWKNWDKIGPIVQKMVAQVQSFLAKLAAPFKWLIGKTKEVGDAFFRLYDRVVGHSYIPDMVDEIGIEMSRLSTEMVQKAKVATDQTAALFQSLEQRVPDTITVPAIQTQAQQGGEMQATPDASLQEAANVLPQIPIMAQEADEALQNIADNGIRSLADGLTAVLMGTAKLGDVFRQVASQIIAELIRIQIQKMLMNLAGSLFGAPISGVPGGARAAGGPVVSGRAYLVGERGPEMFMPGANGRIVPNEGMGVRSITAPITFNISGNPSRETLGQIAAKTRQGIAQANRKGF